MNLGEQTMDLLERASAFSEPGPGVTRRFCSPEHAGLFELLEARARGAGLEVELDAAANLVIRKPSGRRGAPLFLMGSHQDTVRHGGKYDGMLGVAAPLVALEAMTKEGLHLPFDVELVAFGDEEGLRFTSTLVGSSAIAGRFDPALLDATDEAGVTMRAALEAFGGRPDDISKLSRAGRDVLGYLEVHIEQGPVLESQGHALGVVDAITGIERYRVGAHGRAGHAGTVPMHQRRDALVVGARIVEIVDRICHESEGLVGVVGQLDVTPNAVNVIPSRVDLTIELRAPDPRVRADAARRVLEEARAAAAERQVGLDVTKSYEAEGVECDPALSARLADSVRAVQPEVPTLFSGAGHDGLAMRHLTGVAMLFVRCAGGVSHDPTEAITVEDADLAARTVKDFLQKLGADHALS